MKEQRVQFGEWKRTMDEWPTEPDMELDSLESIVKNIHRLEETLVTLEDADMPTSMFYIGSGEWWDAALQRIERPIAWMELPDAYVPEQE